MRLLYLTAMDLTEKGSGVSNKILGHIRCFQEAGIETDYIHFVKASKTVEYHSSQKDEVAGTYKYIKSISVKKIMKTYLNNLLKTEKYDFVYIRFLFGRNDPWTIGILKVIKKYGVRILWEIPTFPYDRERKKMELFIDKMYRNKLKNYVERMVTFGPRDSIFGAPTIVASNGVIVSNINVINCEKEKEDNTINVFTVALFVAHHGYERILKGLGNYYADGKNTTKVVLHMVGDGSVVPEYKRIISEMGIEDYVIFYGKKHGIELDDIYEKADIALGGFGEFKQGVETSSGLKTKEYLAKGLPFTAGAMHDIFLNENKDFFLKYSNDATDVDISRMVDWYNSLIEKYGSKKNLALEIRKFAEEKVDMSVAMKPVVDYIFGNKQ